MSAFGRDIMRIKINVTTIMEEKGESTEMWHIHEQASVGVIAPGIPYQSILDTQRSHLIGSLLGIDHKINVHSKSGEGRRGLVEAPGTRSLDIPHTHTESPPPTTTNIQLDLLLYDKQLQY